jgi:hypothetical protein
LLAGLFQDLLSRMNSLIMNQIGSERKIPGQFSGFCRISIIFRPKIFSAGLYF